MAINPSIPLSVQPPQFASDQDAMIKAMSLKQLMNQNAANELAYRKAQQDLAETEAFKTLGKNSMVMGADGNPTMDLGSFVTGAYGINPEKAFGYQTALTKSNLEQRKLKAEITSADYENATNQLKTISNLLSGVTDQDSYNIARGQLVETLGAEAVKNVPEVYDPDYVAKAGQWALTAKDKLDAHWKQQNFDQKDRHHQATQGKPTIKEIHDPNSPTGTSMAHIYPDGRVEKLDAQGKMPTSTDIEITTDAEGNQSITYSMGGNKGTTSDLTKPTANKVQAHMLEVGDVLSELNTISSRFQEKFQTIPYRTKQAFTGLKAKWNTNSISEQDKGELKEFVQYRRDTYQLFANILKALSGVAVNPTELKRAEQWIPFPGQGIFDGDDPVTMEAKIEGMKEYARKAMMKYAYINKYGLSVDDVDIDDMPSMMRRRGNELYEIMEKDLMAKGMAGAELEIKAKEQTRMQLADEFGLTGM